MPNLTDTGIDKGEEELFLKRSTESSDEIIKKNVSDRIKEYTSENTFCKPNGGKVLLIFLLALMASLFGIMYLLYSDTETEFTKDSQGSARWPDSACPVATPFGKCDSNFANDGNLWATAVCQKNGFDSGEWTGTKSAGCSGKVAMYCEHEFLPSPKCRETYRHGCYPEKQSRILVKCLGEQEEMPAIQETAPELSTIGLDTSLKEIKSIAQWKDINSISLTSPQPNTLKPTPGPHEVAPAITLKPTPGPHEVAIPVTLKPTPGPHEVALPITLKPTPGPHEVAIPITLKPTPGPQEVAPPLTLKPTPGPHAVATPVTLKPTPWPHEIALPAKTAIIQIPNEPASSLNVFSNERRSVNRLTEPLMFSYKYASLDICPGSVKVMLTSPNGDTFCITGSLLETTLKYSPHSGEDVEWCLYVEVAESEQQNYRVEVTWHTFHTRRGRSRVYVQKDSQTPKFSSGSSPLEQKDSSLRVDAGEGQRSMCVRWVAANIDNDRISFTIGVYRDIGKWINGQCTGGGGDYYDRWWDGSCGVVYQQVTEECPRSPDSSERCGEYSYDQLCRIATCGTRTLEDNNNSISSPPQFLNGYGMIDPDDPDLYKIEYSKRKSFDIKNIISVLKERKASLEARWEKYGGEKVFTTAINKNPYKAEAETRLGFKLARALLLGDKFTIGFTGSSNTAGQHNMFYNTYPMQLQAFMRPIFSQHGYMGAAFQSKNNAWGGVLGTWTEAWCVKAMAGDVVDIVTWENYMNDGGTPERHICEIHLRNALFLKKRPLYHVIHAGKECSSSKWDQTELRSPWKEFNDHYHNAGAGMIEIWPCHGSWQLALEKGENSNTPRWLYVTWHPGPLGHREYAEILAWNYLNSALGVLEPLQDKIQEAAPKGVPTSKLDETLKEPDVEPVPEPLYCGETCKGLGAAKASTNCLTALEPANQESTLTYLVEESTKWRHENGAAWADNYKTLSSKKGGMNANDRKFRWSGGSEEEDGRFRFEIEVAYKYVLILAPYGYHDEKLHPPLPSAQWNITANGESMRCLTSNDWNKEDQFALTNPQLLGNRLDPETKWPGCIFGCGAGLKKIEIWHNEGGSRIWIDNVIGV